jgi:hypothetical protein
VIGGECDGDAVNLVGGGYCSVKGIGRNLDVYKPDCE